MSTVFIEGSVRGHHAYFNDVTVVIGEVLMCERELDNFTQIDQIVKAHNCVLAIWHSWAGKGETNNCHGLRIRNEKIIYRQPSLLP